MFKKLFRVFDHEYRELEKFKKIADQVFELENKYKKYSDEELKNQKEVLKKELKNGKELDEIIPDAFAIAREASYRVLKEKPYYCQVLGALALHFGNIAEMKTGEGKTLTSVMTAYLNALLEKGVHIVTVNEYLAQRDANWMGQIFKFLGMSVGVNLRELSPKEKREAYLCDILYTTNNELGFDYLRDNMVVKAENRVQRPLYFAIVDEVDSIFIDEARTPLIISGGQMKLANLYKDADRYVKTLKENEDYTIDQKTRDITLTEEGTKKAERYFKLDNLFDIKNSGLVHHINQSLKANYTMKKDVDYVVQDDKIIIVDQFTGRLMHGRAFSDGLHQAIEAKEGVTIQEETRTLATITFQNYFRMYQKLAGMTGTAKTEEEEFRNIYNMYVIQIPTNMPVIRIDEADLIYSKKEEKYKAIINEIEKRHKTGQPILVGTIAIETNELISNMLRKRGIPHEVLNAKNHAREAEIIAKAGQKGSVTIATNMAGRGTDIKLGEGVKELGGLCVIGTERHEARRIDNQLRGRSGRQGDPGYSQFFVSFEDELLVRFGTDRFQSILDMVGLNSERNMRSKTITKSVETAQKRVEGNNFDIRKTLLQYDDVMSKHREIMYERRNEILDKESIHDQVIESFKSHIKELIRNHIDDRGNFSDKDISEIIEYINENLLNKHKIKEKDIIDRTPEEVEEILFNIVKKEYDDKLKELLPEIANEFEKTVSLNVIDNFWMDHINTMDHLREGIGLRGYAQESPIQAYINEGFALFDNMLDEINKNITLYLLKAEVRQNLERKEVNNKQTNSSDEKIPTQSKSNKVGRNEPCPCGSGKKYKMCCGK